VQGVGALAPTGSGRTQSGALTGCGKTLPCCHPEPIRCHPEAKPKDLCHFAQGKLREGSRSAHFHANTRFFVVPQGGTPQNDSAYEFFRNLLDGAPCARLAGRNDFYPSTGAGAAPPHISEMTMPARMSAEPTSTFPPRCSPVTRREVSAAKTGSRAKINAV